MWRGWAVNKDGAGFSYVDREGQLQVKKGYIAYSDFDGDLKAAYEEHGKHSPFLIHMRYATRGTVTSANTHPFHLRPTDSPEAALAHNGTMFTPEGNWAGTKDDLKSDSRVFAAALNNVLGKPIVSRVKKRLEKSITVRNKVVLLYADKSFIILNEDEGYWKDDIWYSNRGCEWNGRN